MISTMQMILVVETNAHDLSYADLWGPDGLSDFATTPSKP